MILAEARAWHEAGFCVVPAKADGTKAPMLDTWTAMYQGAVPPPTAAQVEAWFAGGHPGIGLLCGAASGNLEMLEWEGRAVEAGLLEAFGGLAAAAGLGGLWESLKVGYVECTPSGGVHVLYRVEGDTVPGNTRLASTADRQVLIETRGHGGFVVVAPSHGPVHPSGRPWAAIAAIHTPANVPTISRADRNALIALARSMDQLPAVEPYRSPPPRSTGSTLSPMDDFENRVDWSDALLLGGAGWAHVYTRGGTRYWRRPDKRDGISATTGQNPARDRLYVFSTSTIFESERSYTKPGAYAQMHHGGNMATATADLRRLGYGEDRPLVVATDDTEGIIEALESASSITGDGLGATSVVPDPVREARILAEAERMRVSRQARALVDAEDFAAGWTAPTGTATLTEELALPDEPLTWRVDRLLLAESNVLLVATQKAGKTTLVSNLLRSLADGQDFLGRFPVEPPSGRIAMWNYEVGEAQYRRWLRDIGIGATGLVTVLNLRGLKTPLLLPEVRAWAVEWLKRHEISVWIVDPFGRAFSGSGDENDNSAVSLWLESLDEIKSRAGVRELILATHTGHSELFGGQERARGAKRLGDWTDIKWAIIQDDTGRRFFSASGRDVDVEEALILFDPLHRGLSLGMGDREEYKRRDFEVALIDYVRANPGETASAISSGLEKRKSVVIATLAELVQKFQLSVSVELGGHRKYHPVSDNPHRGDV